MEERAIACGNANTVIVFQTGVARASCVVGVITHHDTIGRMERINVSGMEFKDAIGENG